MTQDAFCDRIARMTDTLHRVCYTQLNSRHDREDAVQGALVKAWQSLHKLKDDKLFETWLIRILLNECRDIYRRNKRLLPCAEVYGAQAATWDRDQGLREALLALPLELRTPVLLHYIEGYPVEQVAQMLKMPVGTVKSRMLRARNELRILLAEEVFES